MESGQTSIMTFAASQSDASKDAYSESDLRLALGPNAEDYLGYIERRKRLGVLALWGWNWWGLLMPLPWFFYRKLWRLGAVLLLLPLLLDTQFGWDAEIGFVLAAIIAAFGKPLVLEQTMHKLREATALGLGSAEGAERLRRAGGVSRIGALLGVLLSASYIYLAYGSPVPAPLPGCQAQPVVRMVLQIAEQDLAHVIPSDRQIELRDAVPAEANAGAGRLCYGDVVAAELVLPVQYRVTWLSRAERLITVDLKSRPRPEIDTDQGGSQ